MDKILLITQDYYPNQGGVARYYKKLVAKLGDRVSVLTSVAGSPDVGVFRKNYFSALWPTWWPLIKLIPEYYWKTNSKILWAGDLLPVGTVCWLLKKIYGWKYIVSVHGLDVQLTKTSPLKKILAKKILLSADLIICNSQFTSELVRDFTTNPTVVVYPEPELLPPAKQELVSKVLEDYKIDGKKVIFTLSRLVKRKGIDEVIEAVKRLYQIRQDFVYIVAGGGPEESALKKLAVGLPVIFLGSVEDDVARACLQLCRIFIMTPQDNKIDVEGFGIVFAEAAMFGKPIVGRAVGGVKEAVGDNAIWVDGVDDIVLALNKMLSNNDLCLQLGEGAKKFVLAQLNNNSSESLNSIFSI